MGQAFPPLISAQPHGDARDPTLAPAIGEPADRTAATRTITSSAQLSALVSAPPVLIPIATQVPPAPAPVHVTLPRDPRTTDAYRSSAVPEATEVHVSIGRIELTAVHDAPMPARRAAPVKSSVPLREYLARGQRSSP
jgi:hypothetical protein